MPRPEFIMLYNGTQDMPEYFELKLSDNFAGEGDINLQLTVKVYNINEGKNLDTETIAKATGLTPEEVVNLTNK